MMIGRKVKLIGDDKIYTVVDKIKIVESYNYDVDGYMLMDETGMLSYKEYTKLERISEEDWLIKSKSAIDKLYKYKEGEGGWVGPPPRNEFC